MTVVSSFSPTIWSKKKEAHENRLLHGWKNKLEEGAVSRNLVKKDAFFSYEERRRSRMAESGWKNVIVHLPAKKPPRFSMPDTSEDAEEEEIIEDKERGNYCMICMALVANSSIERSDCSDCRNVIHKKCIIGDDNNFFKQKKDISPKGKKKRNGLNGSDGKNTDEFFSSSKWTCSFCMEDVESKKHYQQQRHHLLYRDSVEIFAIVKVQSFARMVRYRLDYIFAIIGFTKLQKLYRTKKLWQKFQKFEEKRQRPFRLKLHEIRLFVKNTDSSGPDMDPDFLMKFKNISEGKKIGECGAGPYEMHFKSGRASTNYDSVENPFLEFFHQGHIDAPEYNISMKETHSFPRGSLFMSVCIHEMDDKKTENNDNNEMKKNIKKNNEKNAKNKNNNDIDDIDINIKSMNSKPLKQLYRIDIPLRMKKDAKSEKISMNSLINLGMPPMDQKEFEKISDKYRLVSFGVEFPYIMIPKCTSCVSVTLTVSQVTIWPRAVSIGQSIQEIKKFVFTNKVTAWHQWLTPSSWTTLPEPDEGKKLVIGLQDNLNKDFESINISQKSDPNIKRQASTGEISFLPSIATSSPNRKNTLKEPKILFSNENNIEVYGGIITWSLLTMTNENLYEGGYLSSTSRGGGNNSKRDIWCVLVDRIFYNYAPDNLKPRCQADLKYCLITAIEGGIFRVDSANSSIYSFKTLYFTAKSREESNRWFYKLYTQSASNNIQKYSNLNFNLAILTPFSMISPECDVVKGIKNLKNEKNEKDGKSRVISPILIDYRNDPSLGFLFAVKDKDNEGLGRARSSASIIVDSHTPIGEKAKRKTLLDILSSHESALASTLKAIILASKTAGFTPNISDSSLDIGEDAASELMKTDRRGSTDDEGSANVPEDKPLESDSDSENDEVFNLRKLGRSRRGGFLEKENSKKGGGLGGKTLERSRLAKLKKPDLTEI